MLRQRAGRRVVDRALAAGRAGDGPAADPVADPTRGGDPSGRCPALRLVSSDRTSSGGMTTILLASRGRAGGCGQKRGRVSGSGQTGRPGVVGVGAWRSRPAHGEDDQGDDDSRSRSPIAISPPALSRPRRPGRARSSTRRPGRPPTGRSATKNSRRRAAGTPGHQDDDGQDRQDGEGRDPLVAPATGPTAAPAPASPTGPGRDRPSPRRHRSAGPGPCPSGPSSACRRRARTGRAAAATCSQRPTEAPSRLAT